jgi:hypothetical protein
MIIGIQLLLALVALAITVGSAMGKAPLWAAVLIICVMLLLMAAPLR